MISKLNSFRESLHPGAYLWTAPFLIVLIQKEILVDSLYKHPKELVSGVLQAFFFGTLIFLNWIYSRSNKKALFFSIAISFLYLFTKTQDLTFYDSFPIVTLIWVLLLNMYTPVRKTLLIGFCILITLLAFLIMQPQMWSQEFQLISILIGLLIISQLAVNYLIKPSIVFRRISIFLGLNAIICMCTGVLTSLTQYLTIGLATILTAISVK